MRIVTLLPAATEIVAALGQGDRLVGISHECDYPPEVQHLPRVTTSPIDPSLSSDMIDRAVRQAREQGRPVIGIEAAQLRRLAPELILTQGLCEVCAVSDGEVYRLAEHLTPAPRIISLKAHDLEGIWTDVRAVATALGVTSRGEQLLADLALRLQRLRDTVPATRLRIVCIEWLDPLYLAGHWVPELVSAAGGTDVGAAPGSRSKRSEWRDIEALQPAMIIVMLCGFGVERAASELRALNSLDAAGTLRTAPVWILDGNAYTSRPGPRVVDAAERIRAALLGREMEGLRRWDSGALQDAQRAGRDQPAVLGG